MLLKDYLPNINKKFENFNFTGLAFDSKEVKKNYIFIFAYTIMSKLLITSQHL